MVSALYPTNGVISSPSPSLSLHTLIGSHTRPDPHLLPIPGAAQRTPHSPGPVAAAGNDIEGLVGVLRAKKGELVEERKREMVGC